MADTKVSSLTFLATIPDNTDVLYIVDAGTSKQITYQNLVGNSIADLDSRIVALSGNQSVNLSGSVTANTAATELLRTDYTYLSSEIDTAKTSQQDIGAFVDQGVSQTITLDGTTLTILSGIITNIS